LEKINNRENNNFLMSAHKDNKLPTLVIAAIIIIIFAYYYFISPQTTNPIDPRNEYRDSKALESTSIVSYSIIGQIEEITNDELKIRTLQRITTVKKPEAIEYIALVPPVPVDESKLQQNDNIRATVDVDKTTNKVVKLSVVVLLEYNTQDGEFKRI
jgi:hypothetical protein